jgi:hypothetical protein
MIRITTRNLAATRGDAGKDDYFCVDFGDWSLDLT